jgi:hypothetical protein
MGWFWEIFKMANILPKKWMNAKLLPPVIWSASRCICEKMPDAWVFAWTANPDPSEERKKYQRDLGLNNTQFLELQNLFDTLLRENEFGYPNVFMSLRAAYQAYFKYFKTIPNLKLISIALPECDVEDFINRYDPQGKYAENGVRKKLRQFQKAESNGLTLGYDVIGYDGSDFHSLLCGYMEQLILSQYSVRFNPYGFIDSFDDATSIIRDIRSCKLGVEDGFWASWLITEYPLDKAGE